MPSVSYPASYRDQFGEEETILENDGHQLRMVLRGVEFRSTNLLWRPHASDLAQLSSFPFSNRGVLDDYILEWDIPLTVINQQQVVSATLRVRHVLGGGGKPPEWKVGSELTLTLSVADQTFTTQGKTATSRFVQAVRSPEEEELPEMYSFERALGILHEEFPEGMYLKICLFCAFSDYNPTAHGLRNETAQITPKSQPPLQTRGRLV